MPVNAPYRFARINRWVHKPAWGHLASHDVPFADGLDGEFTVEITACSPICVGGERSGGGDSATAVLPYRLPDGRYAIPKSTLEGMIRSTLEIAAFGRLGERIEARWPAIRDLSAPASPTVQEHFKDRLTETTGVWNQDRLVVRPKVCAGWLHKADNAIALIPCELSRPHISDVFSECAQAGCASNQDAFENGGDDAPERYELLGVGADNLIALEKHFLADPKTNHPHTRGPRTYYIHQSHCKVVPAGTAGSDLGTVVVTGRIAGSIRGQGKKKREFTFYSPSRTEVINGNSSRTPLIVSQDVCDAFLDVNVGRQDKSTAPAWLFWRSEFNEGRPVPVFWIADQTGEPEAIGLSYMFKMPFGASTSDLLGNSSEDHLAPPEKDRKTDLPSTILGEAAFMDDGGNVSGRKGRLTILPAIATSKATKPQDQPVTRTLTSPKPGFYSAYVRQGAQSNNAVPGTEPMAVFSPKRRGSPTETSAPELAGVKLWPAAAQPDIRRQPIDRDLKAGGDHTLTHLHPLPKETSFATTLRFHNLRPVELGAVLWALRLGMGDDEDVVRRLGMGKAYGLGEVTMKVGKLRFFGPDTPDDVEAADYLKCFEEHMTVAYATREANAPEGAHWADSPQVRALRAAATPGAAGHLEVMDRQEQTVAKKNQAFLPAFVDETAEISRVPVNHPPPPPQELAEGDHVQITAGPGVGPDLIDREGIIIGPLNRRKKYPVQLLDDAGRKTADQRAIKAEALRLIDRA